MINWLSHLDNLGVVVNTATLESFLNLESSLRNGALLYNRLVVRILAGHLVKMDRLLLVPKASEASDGDFLFLQEL